MSGRERDASDAFAEGVNRLVADIGAVVAKALREAWPEFAPAPDPGPAPGTECPPLCHDSEGATGVSCQLGEGHPLPHEGWHRDDGDESGEYAILVSWPVPDRPARLGGVPALVRCAGCGHPIEPSPDGRYGRAWVHYRTGRGACPGGRGSARPAPAGQGGPA